MANKPVGIELDDSFTAVDDGGIDLDDTFSVVDETQPVAPDNMELEQQYKDALAPRTTPLYQAPQNEEEFSLSIDPAVSKAFSRKFDEVVGTRVGIDPENRETVKKYSGLLYPLLDAGAGIFEGVSGGVLGGIAAAGAGVMEDARYLGLNIGPEDRARFGLDLAEFVDIGSLMAGGHTPNPADLTKVRAEVLGKIWDSGASVDKMLEIAPDLNRAQLEAAEAYRRRTGEGARFDPLEAKLQEEAAAFQNRPIEQSPLEAEAAAFRPRPEPSVEDVFPSPEKIAADEAAMSQKLQAEADAFKNKTPIDLDDTFKVVDDVADAIEAPRPRTGLDIDAANAKVLETAKDWKNAPEMRVVSSVEDLDDAVRKQIDLEGPDVVAVINDGKVHILGDRLESPDDIPAIVFHEALGHHGLAQKFGDGLGATLDRFYDQGGTQFKGSVDQWLVDNADAYKNLPPKQRLRAAVEEVLAEMSESGQIKNKFIDILTNYIKTYARKARVKLSYSPREIRTILGQAHQAVIDGKPGASANGFRYMRRTPEEIRDSLTVSENLHVPSYVNKYTEHEKRFSHQLKYTTAEGNEVRAYLRGERGNGNIDIYGSSTNELGVAELRELSRAVREKLPEIKTIGGIRVTGARTGLSDHTKTTTRVDATKFARRKPETQTVYDEAVEEGKTVADRLASVASIDDFDKTFRDLAESMPAKETITMAELKSQATRLGVSANKVMKQGGGSQEVAKKLYAMEQAQRKLFGDFQANLSKLEKNFSSDTHSKMLEQVFALAAVKAKVQGAKSDVARALNATKVFKETNLSIEGMLEKFREFGGPGGGLGDKDEFLRFARLIQQQLQNGNIDGASNLATQVIKPYWWQYALTARHSAMLSGLATHAKNSYDGLTILTRELEEAMLALPIHGVRKALGLKNEGVSPAEISAQSYGMLRAALDSETYMNTAKAFWTGKGPRHVNQKFDMGDARIPVLSKTGDLLNAADTFFRSFYDSKNLYALGVREAQKQGFSGKRAFEEGSMLAQNPTKEMLTQMKRDSDVSLLVDSPFLSKLESVKSIRPGMSGEDQFKAFASNMVLPFFRVTDRLIFQKLRRTPLSFLDRVTREDFKAGGARRDIAIARTMYGTGLVTYYWLKAGEGEIEGAAPPYEKQRALEAGGYLPNSVKKDGKYTDASAVNFSLDPTDLHNSLAANIATIRKGYEKTKGSETGAEAAANALAGVTKATFSVLSSASFAENLELYMKPFKESQPETTEDYAMGNLAAGVASQFVPAGMRQTAQMTDDVKRDTTGDKSMGDRVVGRVKSAIPGLSDDLPAKYTVYGEEQKQGRTVLGMNNSQDISDDPVKQELQRLERTQKQPLVTAVERKFKRMDDESVKKLEDFLGTDRAEIRKKLYANDTEELQKLIVGEKELHGEEYQTLQRVSGQYFMKLMRQIIAKPKWKELPDIAKKIVVKEALSEARSAAKDKLYPITEPEKEDEDVD